MDYVTTFEHVGDIRICVFTHPALLLFHCQYPPDVYDGKVILKTNPAATQWNKDKDGEIKKEMTTPETNLCAAYQIEAFCG